MSLATKWTIIIISWLIFVGLTIIAIFQQTSGGASGVVLSMVFSMVGIFVGLIPIFLPEITSKG
jgi:magnesium-transporting ATPase (P-type)